MSIYKDYVGLNICIYDPIESDFGCRRVNYDTGDKNKPYTTGSMTHFGRLKYVHDYSDYEFSPQIFRSGKDPLDQAASSQNSFAKDYWANLQGYLIPGVNAVTVKDGSYHNTQSYMDYPSSNSNTSTLTMPNQSNKSLVLLNLHRNGPYGYGSWKQIRASNTPLLRFQKRHSVFTYVKSPGKQYLRNNGSKFVYQQDRFSSIVRTTEPAIHGNQHPLKLIAGVNYQGDEDNPNEFSTKAVELKLSFGNETTYFANEKNNLFFNTIAETDENYENMKDLYLDGAIERDDSPIDEFTLLNYKQTIFPREKYAYLNRTRSRVFFQNNFWRDSREERTLKWINNDLIANIFTSSTPVATQSMWPLDAEEKIETLANPGSSVVGSLKIFDYYIGGESGDNARRGTGILQNTFCRYARGGYNNSGTPEKPQPLQLFGGIKNIPFNLTAACLYSIPHVWPSVSSFFNPSGLEPSEASSVGIGLGSMYGGGALPTASLFRGNAAWDAAKLSGKKPFHKNYDDFCQDIRLKGQGYSIIPEFRVSSHVEQYETLATTEELPSIFELSGASYNPIFCSDDLQSCSKTPGIIASNSNAQTDNKSDFYKILSTSDFLRHFELIKNDHNGFVEPKIITLRCKGIKKFLPYDGFYPAQRTVEISKQFYNSYKDNIKIIYTASVSTGENNGPFAPQLIMNPLFAPGVLFNSIKSGVAVDYPIVDPKNKYTSYFDLMTQDDDKLRMPLVSGQDFLNQADPFDEAIKRPQSIFRRIPFESLLNPENYLANIDVGITDPHPFAYGELPSTSADKFNFISRWNGNGNKLYKKMANNFLAEVPNFFLKNQSFSTISSLESSDPNFGNAESGSFYTMRLKMYRTTEGRQEKIMGFDRLGVEVPQDIVTISQPETNKTRFPWASRYENFTMYSRPSAFGPPMAVYTGQYEHSMAASVKIGSGSTQTHNIKGLGPALGTNYPYTPPYYHGEAWCDLIFECKETKKYTLDEIINEVKEYPYYTRWWWPDENDALRDLTGYRNDYPTGSNLSTHGFGLAYVAQHLQITDAPYSDYAGGPWDNLIRKSNLKVIGPYRADKNFNFAGTGPRGFPDGTSISLSTQHQQYYTGEPGTFTDGWTAQTGSWKQISGSNRIIPPQEPYYLNENALQLKSSLNIFGQGIIRNITTQADESKLTTEVADSDTNKSKSRWIIQTKFETPMLNFNKYDNLSDTGCTVPASAEAAAMASRGMWHQYGISPSDPSLTSAEAKAEAAKGVYMQVSDLPPTWLKGALGVGYQLQKRKVRSLKDLVGFSSDPVKLGQAASVKQIGEVVAAVPFIEKAGVRQFFTIPREDIDEAVDAIRREVSPGVFVAGGAPAAGLSVVNMVKLMQKYVFPPSMDFVKYEEIDPFAMYLFEFTHNLTNKDLTDIWQNLPPEISTSFEEQEVSVSHELLSHELLGGGVQKNTVSEKGQVNTSAPAPELPSNIQWMIFKVKQRAESNYFEQVVGKKGSTSRSRSKLEKISLQPTGESEEITYNWPYDFFSLVELVKIDAEVSFAKTEEISEGARQITTITRKKERVPSASAVAFGKEKE